jgi:methionine synthase II (cobalamin-independent)
MLFPTTIAGSLPKPEWLAEPNTLWAPWKSKGDELVRAKRDATMLAVKLQEDAGVDIVTEGEQARQHFVHGFLEKVEGIDFAHKVEMGIRKDRYKAMVPQVVAPLTLKGRVHADEARVARTHTTRKLKFTLPGPMTIADTVADRYYGDKSFTMKVIAKYTRETDPEVIEHTYEFYRKAGFRRDLTVSEPGVQGILDFLSETIPEAKKATPAQFFDDRFVRQLNSGR